MPEKKPEKNSESKPEKKPEKKPKKPNAQGAEASPVLTRREQRRDFHVLVVDRDDERRGQILDWLTELGFGSVQVAAAPDSAASFADAQPPHVALIAAHPESEARSTIGKLKAISRETQAVLVVNESTREAVLKARALALSCADERESAVWDVLSLPAASSHPQEARVAVELTMDRVTARMYFQFETEHWQERWRKLKPKDRRDPVSVRDRLYASTQEFSRVRDLDAVLTAAVRSFARVADDQPVLYLKWVPIRRSFAVSHIGGQDSTPKEKLKGLGLPVSDNAQLKELSTWTVLQEFVRDAFGVTDFTSVLHGSPLDPEGLFIFIGTKIDETLRDEFEALSFLFDLTWSRMEALRDRHALERIDRVTGLPNKKALRETLDFECTRARRLRHPLSAAAIELGDNQGGEVESKLGATFDAVMKVAGSTLRRALRGTDYVARVDRRRLTVLMPHTSVAEAVGVIDRMCRLLERLQLPALESVGVERLKARAGVAEYPRLSSDADTLLQGLDDALTAAWMDLKQAGKNAGPTDGHRVMVFEVPPGFEPDFIPVLATARDDGGLE